MKKVFLTLIAVSTINLFVVFLKSDDTSHTSMNKSFLSKFLKQEDESKSEQITGAMEWRMKHLVNPITGLLDVDAILHARQQYADYLHNSADRSAALNINFEELGPDNVGGRTRGFVIDNQSNGQRLYSGSVSGGLWISDNAGELWHQNVWTEDFQSVPIGSIAQAPNGDIYVGTGEGHYDNFGFGAGGVPGYGIYMSTDDAQTFTLMSGTSPAMLDPDDDWAHINDLVVHPDGSKIYAATTGGIQIFDGSSWNPGAGVSSAMAGDLEISSDGSLILAEYNNRVYRSTDAGASWSNLSNDTSTHLPPTGSRVDVAISPQDADYAYAAVANSAGCLTGIYKTTNGGDVWMTIGQGGSLEFDPFANAVQCQGYYDNIIQVDLINKNRVFVGGVTLWSYSSSESWKQVDLAGLQFLLPYYVHADKHNIVFDPHDASGNTMYIACDGGVFRSTNAQSTDPEFEEVNKGYSTTQFYGVGASRTGAVGGGTQDNGTQYNDFSNNTWSSFLHAQGGDGGFVEISQLNPYVMFAELPYGELTRSGNGGENFSCIYDCHIDNRCVTGGVSDCLPTESASFVMPFSLWEDLATGDNIIIIATKGVVWALNDPINLNSTPAWVNLTGNMLNAPTILAGGEIEAMATSADLSHIYVGNVGGKLYRIDGFGPNTDFTAFDPNPNSSADDHWDTSDLVTHIGIDGGTFGGNDITGIAVDQNDPDHIVVTIGGYFNGNHVWESFDATSATPSFTSIQGDLADIPVYDAVIDFADGNNIVIATEMGVWSTNDGSTWTSHNAEIGTVPCFQIRQIKYRDDACRPIYLATHGRGLWRSGSLLDGCTLFSVGVEETFITDLNIYPNPAQTFTHIEFSLFASSDVAIQVYDISGRLVKTIHAGKLSSGTNKIKIDTQSLTNGTYFVNITANGMNKIAKLVITK